jgi:hypothetical protein
MKRYTSTLATLYNCNKVENKILYLTPESVWGSRDLQPERDELRNGEGA